MNIIAKESIFYLVFETQIIKRRKFLPHIYPDLAMYLRCFCSVVILRYDWDPKTRYQTFARAEDIKLFIKM